MTRERKKEKNPVLLSLCSRNPIVREAVLASPSLLKIKKTRQEIHIRKKKACLSEDFFLCFYSVVFYEDNMWSRLKGSRIYIIVSVDNKREKIYEN